MLVDGKALRKIMKADEARRTAEEAVAVVVETELATARRAIESAAKRGQTSTTVRQNLKPETVRILTQDGYGVRNDSCQREGEWCEITW